MIGYPLLLKANVRSFITAWTSIRMEAVQATLG